MCLFKRPDTIRSIDSLERLTLRETGMRFCEEYEIICKGEEAEVTLYGIRFNRGEDIRIPEKRKTHPAAAVLELVNSCGVASWNGFHGAHPKGVLDGTMFRLEALANGGARICAEGSQNFPRKYRDFTNGLRELLEGGELQE